MEKIGAKLKQQRLAKRLSLEEINAAIRTPLKYLSALEIDNVTAFPAEVYYLGSLRKYATYLGLDANELVGVYKQNMSTVVQETLPEKEERQNKSTKKIWLGALIVISSAVLAGIIILIIKSSDVSNCPTENQMPVVQQPVKQEPEKPFVPVAQPKAVKQPEQSKTENKRVEASPFLENGSLTHKEPVVAQPSNNVESNRRQKTEALTVAVKPEAVKPVVEGSNKKYNLEVEAVTNCWVKVIADGSTVYSTILEKGSKKHWSAGNDLAIVIGYVPGLRVKLNGKDIDITKGSKQDINEIHFKPEDVQ